ncbi:MAG: hypothetical protein ACXABD_03495 [Candidatus Thorarchaeota archaeon]|jgi:hypothetical protein
MAVKKSNGFTFPLIKNFLATTYIKAFILNAIAAAIIAALSIEMRSYLDRVGRKAKGGWDLSDASKTLIVFVSGFTVAMIVYAVMYLLVGFGGGMLAD